MTLIRALVTPQAPSLAAITGTPDENRHSRITPDPREKFSNNFEPPRGQTQTPEINIEANDL